MIVLACIAIYLAFALLVARRLRRQSPVALKPPIEQVNDEQLDISVALRKASR